MNFFLVLSFCLCIASINANFTIIEQIPSPNTSITSNTKQFIFGISQPVNAPSFQAFIHFCNATTNVSIYQIDVHLDTVNVTYSNNTLTFNTSGFNVGDEFYITFDTGVLFSNISNSSAITDPYFWHLKVIDIQRNANVADTITYTSVGTTQYVSTDTSTAYSGSTMMYTTVNQTTQNVNTETSTAYSGSTMVYTTVNQTTQNVTTTSASMVTMITGEPPPTRSAKIGMGLGITFISILIIIEIIYFKYCHSGDGRSANYFT